MVTVVTLPCQRSLLTCADTNVRVGLQRHFDVLASVPSTGACTSLGRRDRDRTGTRSRREIGSHAALCVEAACLGSAGSCACSRRVLSDTPSSGTLGRSPLRPMRTHGSISIMNQGYDSNLTARPLLLGGHSPRLGPSSAAPAGRARAAGSRPGRVAASTDHCAGGRSVCREPAACSRRSHPAVTRPALEGRPVVDDEVTQAVDLVEHALGLGQLGERARRRPAARCRRGRATRRSCRPRRSGSSAARCSRWAGAPRHRRCHHRRSRREAIGHRDAGALLEGDGDDSPAMRSSVDRWSSSRPSRTTCIHFTRCCSRLKRGQRGSVMRLHTRMKTTAFAPVDVGAQVSDLLVELGAQRLRVEQLVEEPGRLDGLVCLDNVAVLHGLAAIVGDAIAPLRTASRCRSAFVTRSPS